jgi:uncharacterized membrane protein
MATLHIGDKKITFPNLWENLPALPGENDTTTVYIRATLLGFVGGMRSMTPFSMLNRTRELDPAPSSTIEQILTSPVTRSIIDLMASGELIGDKLPQLPSRISPGPLIGRIGLGALAGMSICRRYQRSLLPGAILGAVAAGAGTYAGYYARTALAKTTKLPDAVLGLLEDGAAFSLGYIAVKDDSER